MRAATPSATSGCSRTCTWSRACAEGRSAKGAHMIAALLLAAAAAQPAPAPNFYATPIGQPVGIEEAKKLAAVASAEARKNGWFMAIAVVDPAGVLVYYEKA